MTNRSISLCRRRGRGRRRSNSSRDEANGFFPESREPERSSAHQARLRMLARNSRARLAPLTISATGEAGARHDSCWRATRLFGDLSRHAAACAHRIRARDRRPNPPSSQPHHSFAQQAVDGAGSLGFVRASAADPPGAADQFRRRREAIPSRRRTQWAGRGTRGGLPTPYIENSMKSRTRRGHCGRCARGRSPVARRRHGEAARKPGGAGGAQGVAGATWRGQMQRFIRKRYIGSH